VTVALFVDTSIVVPDARAGTVFVLGQRGQLLRRLGRRGRGPNEFGLIEMVSRVGRDRIAVFGGQRVVVAEPLGGYMNTIALQPGTETARPYMALADGRIVALRILPRSQTASPEQRSEAELQMYDTSGVRVPGGFRVPLMELVVSSVGDITAPRFGKSTLLRPLDSLVVVARADSFSFDIHRVDGSIARSGARAWEPIKVTQRDIDVSNLRRAGRSTIVHGRSVNPNDAQEPIADFFPPYRDLVVSRDGFIWLRQYDPPSRDSISQWIVFDRSAVQAKTVRAPRQLSITDADGETVLGVWRDSENGDAIRRYRLRQSSSCR
jgi:hypothetical protein